MDLILKYKKRKVEEKIKHYDIDASQGEDSLPLLQIIPYKDLCQYKFTPKYKHKYHFAEIINRITCREKNKPTTCEIELIKEKLNGDYSQESIYKNSNYNQRKHLIYIWQVLNGIESITPDAEFYRKLDVIWNNFNVFYKKIGHKKRAIKYRLVIDVICERLKYDDIRRRLHFKNNLRYRELVNNVLDNFIDQSMES